MSLSEIGPLLGTVATLSCCAGGLVGFIAACLMAMSGQEASVQPPAANGHRVGQWKVKDAAGRWTSQRWPGEEGSAGSDLAAFLGLLVTIGLVWAGLWSLSGW